MKHLLYFFVLIIPFFATADDTPNSFQQAPAWLKETRKAINSKDFETAGRLLNENSDQKNSADWNNLMGFTLRKKSPPDLVESEKHYLAALQIDPKHKGALEYYGELLLLRNDLAGAESMLKRLDQICTFSCEEYRDLKKSIQAFKSQK